MAREVRRFKLTDDAGTAMPVTRLADVRAGQTRAVASRPRMVSGNAALAVDDWSQF